MRTNRKFCNGCESQQFIWKNKDGKKYCLSCWNRISPPKQLKVLTPINKISKKRSGALTIYNRRRERFLKENPVCMFPGCSSTEVTLHHAKGRLGAFLTDKRFFKSLCWPHHKWVEEHPEEAKKLQLSYSRL